MKKLEQSSENLDSTANNNNDVSGRKYIKSRLIDERQKTRGTFDAIEEEGMLGLFTF